MTSVRTNYSAMAALATLRSVNRQLDATNLQGSTGLRINSAGDGAAYWSISSTLRSDNGALRAVKDTLAVGAASVNTAYAGLDTTIEDMRELLAKVSAAMSPSIDRVKIQTEIGALQAKMRTTAETSVMNGRNWLSVDTSPDPMSPPIYTFPTGISRDSGGGFSVATMELEGPTVALFDKYTFPGPLYPTVWGDLPIDSAWSVANTINGNSAYNTLVQASVVEGNLHLTSRNAGMGVIGTFSNEGGAPIAGVAHAGSPGYVEFSAASLRSLDNGDIFKFTITASPEKTFPLPAVTNLEDLAQAINGNPSYSSLVVASEADGKLRLTARDNTKGVIGTIHDGTAVDPGMSQPASGGTAGYVGLTISDLARVDAIKFTITASEEQTFTISGQVATLDFSGVNEARLALRPHGAKYPNVVYDIVLNRDTLAGRVADLSKVTGDELLSAVNDRIRSEFSSKFKGAYSWQEVGINAYLSVDALVFQAVSYGRFSSIEVGGLPPSAGHTPVDVGFGSAVWPDGAEKAPGYQGKPRLPKGILDTVNSTTGFSIAGSGTGINISNITDEDELAKIVSQVSSTLDQLMNAATALGATKNQISQQAALSETLININQSSIGALVDADLEESSVRLKALQTQQQLGLQALSLANASTQNFLSLFR